jgi:Putative motility protein
MNVTNTTAAQSANAASQVPVADAAQILVLKKAINLQAANTATLLDALPQLPSVAVSGSTGRLVDTTA